MPLIKIYKRDGTIVPFDKERIAQTCSKKFNFKRVYWL